MLFLKCAAEPNPPTRCHRSLFRFQITHVEYGETWKEKGGAAIQIARFPILRWRAIQVLIILHWFEYRKTSQVDIPGPYAVPKYRMDGETCRYRFAHPNKCLWVSARAPQPSPLKIARHNVICLNFTGSNRVMQSVRIYFSIIVLLCFTHVIAKDLQLKQIAKKRKHFLHFYWKLLSKVSYCYKAKLWVLSTQFLHECSYALFACLLFWILPNWSLQPHPVENGRDVP